MTAIPATPATSTAPVRFMWLEITGKCQLECVHCYADSGPDGTAGSMTTNDWYRVIDEAASMGIRMVQFIGGEPTLHPDLPDLKLYVAARLLRRIDHGDYPELHEPLSELIEQV